MLGSFSRNAQVLTWLGALPFLLCTVAILSGFEQQKAIYVLQAYAAIIASFISGIHWGIAMQENPQQREWLLITSNIIALIAWGGLFLQAELSLIVMMVLLLCLLVIDFRLYAQKQIEVWFFKLRWRVTLVVVISLAASLGGLLHVFRLD